MDVSKLTIAEARAALDAKEYSAVELTNAYLKNISARDGEIHAYLEVWDESARKEAEAADAIIARGESKALTGIPIAVKDNILIEGRIASAASKMLENYTASYDATVVQKLKAQGVVFLGRTNMDEFALGGSTENSAFGPTYNPHDISRVPGGTSGGSAAAVAAHMALASLGSDTGGSIRQPSAFCGVVGIKPTYGEVSRFGLIAAASSLDQIGAIGKSVEDARALFGAIRGHDSHDSTSLPDIPSPHARPKVIGVPRMLLEKGVDADVLASFEHTLTRLAARGYEIQDIHSPLFEHALETYYIINPAEVSTNLARFDGIRYGHSVAAANIADVYTQSRGSGFGPETRRRILVGTFVLSAGYADAYYRKARLMREAIRNDLDVAFASVGAIALPTSPILPWKFGEKSDPVAMYAADIFTVPVNLAGVPALSIPSRAVERDGKQIPVGFQVIAPHRHEASLFEIGNDIEST